MRHVRVRDDPRKGGRWHRVFDACRFLATWGLVALSWDSWQHSVDLGELPVPLLLTTLGLVQVWLAWRLRCARRAARQAEQALIEQVLRSMRDHVAPPLAGLETDSEHASLTNWGLAVDRLLAETAPHGFRCRRPLGATHRRLRPPPEAPRGP